MRITLRQLAVFDGVASTGSVSRAAEALAMTQSAASMSLRELESHLATPLFHRHGRKLVLSDYGRGLQPRVHRLLAEARDIETGRHTGLSGSIHLAASSTIGNYLLPDLLAKYIRLHPDVRVELTVANTLAVVEATRELRADIGMIEGFHHDGHLVTRVWREDELVIFCAADDPLASRKTLSIEDLQAARWVLREPGSGTREVFTQAIAGKIEQLQLALELGNSEAVKRAVCSGAGIGCLSHQVIADELQRGELQALHCPALSLQRSLFLLTREDLIMTPLTLSVFEFLKSA